MTRAPLTLTALLATFALSGCGASGAALGPAGAEQRESARGSYGAGVTDGRIGDAVTGGDVGPLRELSRAARKARQSARARHSRRGGPKPGARRTGSRA